jgi:hypothetical protein
LLVGDGRLEDGLVGGVQPVDRRLLLVLDAAGARGKRQQLVVLGHPRKVVREVPDLVLDAVHENDAGPRIRIDVELVVRLLDDLLPAPVLPFQRNARLLLGID